METKNFEIGVKRLKRLHTLVVATLLFAFIGFIIAPTNTTWGETPYLLKSVLIMICISDIPLLYWLYDKNVKEKEQSEEERQHNLLKWGAIRLYVWTINVLLCLLLYHFDSDAAADKICPSFYLTALCFLIILALGRVNENDGKKD